MADFEIPLIASAQQLTISLAGVNYQLTVLWRDAPMGGWVMDIADINSNPILSGIPLVTGVDLLDPYGYLNFGGALYIYSDSEQDDLPTYDNLGTGSHLIFRTQ